MPGLDALWWKVLETLEKVVLAYEKANIIMSMGTVGILRKTAVHALCKNATTLLDAGSGPGNVIEAMLKFGNRKEECSPKLIVALDPLVSMLQMIKSSRGGRAGPLIERVRGVFEYLPFRNSAFNGAITSFALRDAFNSRKALFELARTLKYSGRLVVLELNKPHNSRLKELLVYLYFRLASALAGSLVMGYWGLKLYESLPQTYKKYPYCIEYVLSLKKLGFIVALKLMLAGTTLILVAEKHKRI